ncbi:MAG: hypothetical protein V1686_01765 [Patescibacteria group bacterium]
MTLEEADKIFKVWKEYVYPIDWFLSSAFFCSSIPESFLPYPIDVLWEALDIVAKHYWDMGDRKYSKIVQEATGLLGGYQKDDEAIDDMIEKYKSRLTKPEWREIYIKSIKASVKNWMDWIERGKQPLGEK